MTADESGARGAQDARGLGALTHQSEPDDAWRTWLRESDDGWTWRILAPDGREWEGLAESPARAFDDCAKKLRAVDV